MTRVFISLSLTTVEAQRSRERLCKSRECNSQLVRRNMNKESLEMTLCLMLFTYLCVFMNDVVMLHRLDLVYGLHMVQYS